MWKYVDDTTISETVLLNHNSKIQEHDDDLSKQVSADRFLINEDKCKELRITFARSKSNFDSIKIKFKSVDCEKKAKILAVTFLVISSDLNMCEVIKKFNKRLYFLSQLKRAQVKPKELTIFYVTCIRSVIEYACALFHNSLPKYLSDDLEYCPKRALRNLSVYH